MLNFIQLFYDFLVSLFDMLFRVEFIIPVAGKYVEVSYGSFIMVGLIFAFCVSVFWRGARA